MLNVVLTLLIIMIKKHALTLCYHSCEPKATLLPAQRHTEQCHDVIHKQHPNLQLDFSMSPTNQQP